MVFKIIYLTLDAAEHGKLWVYERDPYCPLS